MGLLARYLGRNPYDDRWYTPGPVVPMTDASSASVDGALKIATVYRAVNVAAAAVAVLPIDVLRRRGRRGWEPAAADPFRTKLRLQPNAYQTSFRWRHHLVGHLLLSGNYYAHKHAWALEEQRQLRPLDGARMRQVEMASDGRLRYEYTRASGERVPLDQEDVFHARGFSLDGMRGVNVLDLMRDHVAQASMSRRQRTAFLRNGLRPSVVIKHPKELTETGERNLIHGYIRAYGGVEKTGRPMVLAEGADLVDFQISSRDAQWIESEHFLVEEFLRFVGIPGVLVGFADKTSTYASAEAFFQSFVTHCIWPITGNLEQELTASLYGVQEDLRVRFNLNALMRADSTARAAFYRALVELGIFTRNEVRELEGKNPIQGLDEPLTPKNMGGAIPDGGPAPAPTSPKPPARVSEEGAREEDARAARGAEVARRAALRLVRKEVAAIAGVDGRLGAAARHARDPEGWRAWLTDFYRRHAELVAESLDLPQAVADRYCQAHREEVLANLAAVGTWEATAVPRLVELALGQRPAGMHVTLVLAPPPPAVNVTVPDREVHVPVTVQPAAVTVQPAAVSVSPVLQPNVTVAAPPAPAGPTETRIVGTVDTRIVGMPPPAAMQTEVTARDVEGRVKRAVKKPLGS